MFDPIFGGTPSEMHMDLVREYQREAYEDISDVCDICGCRYVEMDCPCCGGPEGVKAGLTFMLARRPRPNPARLGLFMVTLGVIF